MSNINLFLESAVFLTNFRKWIWLTGTAAWIFGIADRCIAAASDSYLSSSEAMQLVVVFGLLVAWLFMKPTFSK